MKELHESNLGKDFLKRHKNQEKITLLYAAKDEAHCHAIICKKVSGKYKIKRKSRD